MNQISLSNELGPITNEINFYKQQAGNAIFEIGRRLKHVKEHDLTHGQFGEWVRSLGLNVQHAHRYIQAFEQFSPTSANLGFSKILEMLSLPESVEREDFINQPHTIPSTGETKTVDEMTVKELREVKKALKDAEHLLETTKLSADHWQKVAKQAQSMPPRVVTQTVEVVPPNLKKQIEDKDFQIKHLRTGYQEAKEKLQQYELRQTTDFDAEEAQRQREKLQHEAEITSINLRLAYKHFIEKAAISSFMQGAIATASNAEKERLAEMVESAEQIINQTKLALRGRKLGVVNE